MNIAQEHVQAKMNEFSKLKDDWDSYNGRRPSHSAMEGAIKIATELFTENTPPPDIFPVPDGNIQFEWESTYPAYSLEVRIESPDTVQVIDHSTRFGETDLLVVLARLTGWNDRKSQEDIKFLKDLQEELLAQENDGQAAPRYWSIRDYRTVPGNEDCDSGYTQYYYSDGDFTEFQSFSELKEFVERKFEDEVKENITLCSILNSPHPSFKRLWKFVESHLNKNNSFGTTYVKEEEYLRENATFLTKAEAKDHLKSNSHHYSNKARTYAMTAWRAPKMERLINILETFDWEKTQ